MTMRYHQGRNAVRSVILDAINTGPRSYGELERMTDSTPSSLYVIVHRLKCDGLATVDNPGTPEARVRKVAGR